MNQLRHQSRFEKYKGKQDEVKVSSNFDLHVVCTGNRGYSKSLVIRTDHDRYMFNCGESAMKNFTQCINHACATNNIFITYNSWSNIGGLLGSMITMNQKIIRNQPVILHGPPYIEKLLGMSNYFSQVEAMNEKILSAFRCRGVDDERYEDKQLSVEYVKLECQPETHNQSDCDNRMEESGGAVWEKAGTYAVAYIVTPAKTPGRVDKDNMEKLNLKSGPWLRNILKGLPVTLDDGRQINPEDVLLEPKDYKRTILVFECPNKGFLDSLLASEQLEILSRDPERLPWLIVHMSPATVTQDFRYKAFQARFGPRVQHLMMNDECKPECAPRQLQLQTMLNYVHPTIFPHISSHFEYSSPSPSRDGSVVNAMSGLTYNLRPISNAGFKWDEEFCIDQKSCFEEWKKALSEKGRRIVEVKYEQLWKKIKNFKVEKEWDKDYPEIVFLGTGSAEPNIKRNASGILLQTRKDEYIMMDCGESTLAQLYQLYGTEVDDILVNLKAIFISHLHYDHHGGMFNIAEARSKALQAIGRNDSLHIIGPLRYEDWLEIYRQYMNENEKTDIKLHSTSSIYELAKCGVKSDGLKQLQEYLNLDELVCVPVYHTKDSHALILKHTDGWKLVYSGDTRPCDPLVQYGQNCDILIHEGTFDKEFYHKTIATKHSTTDEAIEVGRRMRAKYILLTHFSQRMQVIPEFNAMFTENVGFAFDLMKLKPRDLWLVPLFKPLLKAMFREGECVTSEAHTTPKKEKRKLGSEREDSGKKIKGQQQRELAGNT